MTDTDDLQESIYQEMRGKIKEDDIQAPQRNGPFFYYAKNLQGEQYVVHCRRMAPGGEGPGHVDEVMETGSGAPEEEVLLDENKESREHEFYHVGEVKVNFWVALLLQNILFIILIFLRSLRCSSDFFCFTVYYSLGWFLAWPRMLFLNSISVVPAWYTCRWFPCFLYGRLVRTTSC